MYFVLLFCSFGGANASAACTQTRYADQQSCQIVGSNLLAMHKQNSTGSGYRRASAKCVRVGQQAKAAKSL